MNKPATNQEVSCHVLSDDDGFTLTRFIRGVDRMYADLRFSFRPVMSRERARVMDGRRGLTEEQSILAYAKIIERKVTQWNAIGTDGHSLPINVASVVKLHPSLMQRLFAIVIFAAEGGDVDPAAERFDEQVIDIPDLLSENPGSGGLVEESQKN